MSVCFDAIKNELKERTRQGEFDGTEVLSMMITID